MVQESVCLARQMGWLTVWELAVISTNVLHCICPHEALYTCYMKTFSQHIYITVDTETIWLQTVRI